MAKKKCNLKTTDVVYVNDWRKELEASKKQLAKSHNEFQKQVTNRMWATLPVMMELEEAIVAGEIPDSSGRLPSLRLRSDIANRRYKRVMPDAPKLIMMKGEVDVGLYDLSKEELTRVIKKRIMGIKHDDDVIDVTPEPDNTEDEC